MNLLIVSRSDTHICASMSISVRESLLVQVAENYIEVVRHWSEGH
jgi:hypothetical protein